jgi:hypothetical protein
LRVLLVDGFIDSKFSTKKDEEELKVIINQLEDEQEKEQSNTKLRRLHFGR